MVLHTTYHMTVHPLLTCNSFYRFYFTPITWPLLHLMGYFSLLRTIHEACHAGMLVSTHAFLILPISLYILSAHNRDYIHERMLYNHYSSQNIFLRKISYGATTVAYHTELQCWTCYIQQEGYATTQFRNILHAHATAQVGHDPYLSCGIVPLIHEYAATLLCIHYGSTNAP
jgi:hypothetical protein